MQTGYRSNANMLVCAPTGAGKTNIAMVAVLHEIAKHMNAGKIQKDEFKIVYVAPMKALAAEVSRTFGNRLSDLGIQVRHAQSTSACTDVALRKSGARDLCSVSCCLHQCCYSLVVCPGTC